MLNASKTGRLKPETLLCYHQAMPISSTQGTSLFFDSLYPVGSHIYINIIITNRSPGMFCRNIFPCQVRQRHRYETGGIYDWLGFQYLISLIKSS